MSWTATSLPSASLQHQQKLSLGDLNNEQYEKESMKNKYSKLCCLVRLFTVLLLAQSQGERGVD